MNLRHLIAAACSALLLVVADATAQRPVTGEGPRYPGTTGEALPYDTTGLEDIQKRTLESAGLLSGPVDPSTYPLGPNDVVTLTILTGTTRQYDLVVTPDAKVVVPQIGEVDVREKTLAQATEHFRSAVQGVYRSAQVAVSLRKLRQFKVFLIGAVLHPGTVAATPITRVSEIIDMSGGAETSASKRNISIFRNGTVIDVDLLPFYTYGDLSTNPTVREGDVIKVGLPDPRQVIAIFGAVADPGEVAYRRGDSISTMIRFSSGFLSNAMLDSIEVVTVDNSGDVLRREFVRGRPDGAIIGDRELSPGENIYVPFKPKYLRASQVAVAGEVVYPGTRAIEPGRTRLRDVIVSVGGFSDEASLQDAVLIRRSAQQDRDPELDRIRQIEPEDRTPDEVEYLRVRSRERPGIMTVDFVELMEGDRSENILVADQDSIWVPARKGYVRVGGKVKNPGNVTYSQGRTYQEYVDLAGGYSWRADAGEARIIKGRTGEVFLAADEEDYRLEAGDQIFVPEEPEGNFWEGATAALTIIAQIATIVAVVVSITN